MGYPHRHISAEFRYSAYELRAIMASLHCKKLESRYRRRSSGLSSQDLRISEPISRISFLCSSTVEFRGGVPPLSPHEGLEFGSTPSSRCVAAKDSFPPRADLA